MAKIGKFEDLVAWQKARALASAIYGVTRQGEFARDYGLSGQMQRASVSIVSNLAEGFERNRMSEFHQFLSMAKGSCGELRSQLYIAKDIGYLDEATFDGLIEQSNEVARIIGGLRSSVQRIRNVKSE